MKIGMLWFDNDSKTDLGAKIERAARYYQQKYGKTANMAFVHPSMTGEAFRSGTVEVRTSRSIFPNHIWIGVDD